jgi:RecB family endonuclease NucS
MYNGRAAAELATGDRFILCKPDGAIVVHAETGCDPQNWQPPGANIAITETDPLTLSAVRSDPVETIQVTFETVYHAAVMPMDDDTELQIQGSEADLQDYIYKNPEVIEAGFRPTEKERETKAGPVDIWGCDENGHPVILELKRRTAGPDDVYQLCRYLDHTDAEVRGILVAPSFSDRAVNLLNEHDLDHREVEPPSSGVTQCRSLSEFV